MSHRDAADAERSRPTRKTEQRAEPKAPSGGQAAEQADAKFAGLTVENLMQDIFGEADAAPEQKGEERADTAAASGDAADVPTVTRAKDGQISLTLPSVGKLGEEDEGREGHRLFAAFAAPRRAPRAARRARQKEARAPAPPPLADVSDEEFQLLLDMDYEDELGHAIGFEKIRQYHEKGLNGADAGEERPAARRRPTEAREFVAQGQDTSLRKYYAARKGGVLFRFWVAVVLFALMVLFERPRVAAALHGPFDAQAYPVSYILLGLQLLVLDVALYAKRLWAGLVQLVRFSPTDDALCSVTVLVAILYHICLIFAPHGDVPVLYLSPAGGLVALLAICDLINWRRESAAFQVVSSRKQKYALLPRVSVGGQDHNARARLADPKENETLLYARPVGFVRNYFANTARRVDHHRYVGTGLMAVLSLCVAAGLLLSATGRTFFETLQGALIIFLLCMPAASLLLTSLPMYLAYRLRLKETGALIGAKPVYESTGQTALVLPEAEVFRAMDHEQFELEESCDMTRTMILTRALLEALDSPLAESVRVDAGERIPPENVVFTHVADDGVTVDIGAAKVNVMMGSMAYCQRRGAAVNPRTEEEYGDLQQRLLLVVVDGRLSALFQANYRLNGDVETLLREMARENVRLVVRTRDPGVHGELFRRLQPTAAHPVRVMKPSVGEEDIRTDSVDATVVATGSCRAAVSAYLTARRVRRATRFGLLWQMLSMGIGAAVSLLLTVFGRVFDVPAIAVTLYALLWCLLHALTSFLCLRGKENV